MSTPGLSVERWDGISRGFAGARVLVLGDVMLDHYVHGEVRRISPEAPVPVVEFAREAFMPGGAANVACNLTALGAVVELVGVVGEDGAAGQLREALRGFSVGGDGLVVEAGRPTTCKMRIAAHRQQVVRVDREVRTATSEATRRALVGRVRERIGGCRAVLLADYAKGVLDQATFDEVAAVAREAGAAVFVDPKPPRKMAWRGCALLTPNRRELFAMAEMEDGRSGADVAGDVALRAAIEAVLTRHAPEALLVTLSEAGLVLAQPGEALIHVPTMAREVADVSGAGDTVIASFVLARLGGASWLEATLVANLAAGVVVGKSGTAQAGVDEVRAAVTSNV